MMQVPRLPDLAPQPGAWPSMDESTPGCAVVWEAWNEARAVTSMFV